MAPSTDPFAGHDPLTLFTVLVTGLAVAAALTVYGCAVLARHGVRPPLPRLRALSALTAGAATSLYCLGVARLLLLDETGRDEACKEAVGAARAPDIDAYRASYVPLRLGCHVADGGTYAAGVPGYVNPVALGLALLAITLAILAAFESQRRSRADAERKTGTHTS